MDIRRLSPFAVATTITMILSACGDSSTSVPAPTDPESGVPIGRFEGLAPEGLSYTTDSMSGLTSAGGEFQYVAGETITFSLGGTELGSVAAASSINVFQLAGLDSVPIGEDAIADATRTADTTGGLAQALRLARVLINFDSDGDLANGVQIGDAIRTRLTDVNLGVTGIPSEFMAQDLRRQFYAGVEAGELAARLFVTEADALSSIYDTLGLSPNYYIAQSLQYDTNNDGVLDATERYELDANGLPVVYASDDDGDGRDDYSERYEYLSPTRVTRYQSDFDGDGINDRVTTSTFNALGAVTRRESDSDGQPGVDSVVDYTYDSFGEIVRIEVSNVATGGTSIETRVLDGDGNPVEIMMDSDGDGVADEVERRVYGAFREWTRREIDRENDGVVDTIVVREFNARGQQTLSTTDGGADGTIDRRTEFVVGSDNRYVEFIYDSDADPETDLAVSIRYNASGQEIERVNDRSFENRGVSVTRNEYDQNGNLVRQTIDNNNDGTLNFVAEFSYDSNGNRTSQARDFQGDGLVDQRIDYSVDANGFTVEERVDVGADGVVDAVNRYLDVAMVNPGYYY